MPEIQEICVLIPSHSLEDFPSDLGEAESEGLLNAFAVAWDPVLLTACERIAQWTRADEPPAYYEGKLFLVPRACEGWLSHDWSERARQGGAKVIDAAQTRDEYRAAVRQLFPQASPFDDDCAADFYALGLCRLMVELLTRKMHYFTSINESNLERDAVAAARAAASGDETGKRAHLQSCYEVLLEAREHFYPTDCYLLDLCLLNAETSDDHLLAAISRGLPINFLMKAEDVGEIAGQRPDVFAALQECLLRGTGGLVGGDLLEKPLPLMPINSALWDLSAGHREFERQFGVRPKTWGRKRYGFSTQLPQILTAFGYRSALHVALDDGLYPDEEQSKLRWEGCDGTVLDAITRIPLAADCATSFLRFPDRLAESMQNDQIAGLLFARWPELKTPWLEDFRRMQSYLPVLGRFATFDDFVRETHHSGRLASHQEQEYLTPFVLQAVAYGEADAVSRYVEFFRRRHEFDRAAWTKRLVAALHGSSLDSEEIDQWENRIERSGPDPAVADGVETPAIDSELDDWTERNLGQLAELIVGGGSSQRGVLVVNSRSFARLCALDLSGFEHPPDVNDEVKAVQWDERRREAVVELPGCGFVWIPEPAAPTTPREKPVPSAEGLILRNELFEVLINEKTGGMQHLKNYGRSPNRLSQQTTFRFPRDRTYTVPGDPPREVKTPYAEMRMRAAHVTCAGPALGEIVTESEIVDQTNETPLARCRQTFRVWRHLPWVDLTIELEPEILPDGDPWSNYFAARFAWNDDSAVLTGCRLQSAFPVYKERIEAPEYLEIAEDERRTTLLFGGLPFHRRSGGNMLDTILIPSGETARRFQMRIGFDLAYPLQAAHDWLAPAMQKYTESAPRSARKGWFFQLKQNNVQIIDLLPLLPPRASDGPGNPVGFRLRLLETEGRGRKAKLRLFRPPASARLVNLLGETVRELAVSGDAVLLELRKHQLAEVEIRFDRPPV